MGPSVRYFNLIDRMHTETHIQRVDKSKTKETRLSAILSTPFDGCFFLYFPHSIRNNKAQFNLSDFVPRFIDDGPTYLVENSPKNNQNKQQPIKHTIDHR